MEQHAKQKEKQGEAEVIQERSPQKIRGILLKLCRADCLPGFRRVIFAESLFKTIRYGQIFNDAVLSRAVCGLAIRHCVQAYLFGNIPLGSRLHPRVFCQKTRRTRERNPRKQRRENQGKGAHRETQKASPVTVQCHSEQKQSD